MACRKLSSQPKSSHTDLGLEGWVEIAETEFNAVDTIIIAHLTNPGTTPITILAVNSDHGLSFAGEETQTIFVWVFPFSADLQYFWILAVQISVVWVLVWISSFYGDGGGSRTVKFWSLTQIPKGSKIEKFEDTEPNFIIFELFSVIPALWLPNRFVSGINGSR